MLFSVKPFYTFSHLFGKKHRKKLLGRDFACICPIHDTEYNWYFRNKASNIQDFREFYFYYRWKWCIQSRVLQTIRSGQSIMMRSGITKLNKWSPLLTPFLVEAEWVLDHSPSRTIYNMIDWYAYMIYFIVLLFFETFLQTFETLGEMYHVWDILVFFGLWVKHFGK